MNVISSDELASVVTESVRLDMDRYFRQARNQYVGPWHIEELEQHRTSPGFDQEELVDCLQLLLADHDSPACRELMTRMCGQNVPFMIVAHELSHLRDLLIRLAAEDSNMNAVGAIMTFFDVLEDSLAKIYLVNFLGTLGHRNSVRLRHISALAEKNLLIHFEKHLD